MCVCEALRGKGTERGSDQDRKMVLRKKKTENERDKGIKKKEKKKSESRHGGRIKRV